MMLYPGAGYPGLYFPLLDLGAPLLVDIATVQSLSPTRTVSGEQVNTVDSLTPARTVEGIP